jgi:cytochrome b561
MHALGAVAILATLVLGLGMVHLVTESGLRFALYQWHKSCGALVLALMLLRSVFRFRHSAPIPLGAPWQSLLAKVTHFAMYMLLLALPVVGWAMVSASPLPVPTVIFGIWTLPPLLKPDLTLYLALRTLHACLAWGLCGVVVLHIAGAFTHWRGGHVQAMWRLHRA